MTGRAIATIVKNQREEVRVSLDEFKGHRLVDIRVFTDPYTGDERVATKKGISLAVGKLPALIAALRDAEREARAAGLLADGAGDDAAADQQQTILAAG